MTGCLKDGTKRELNDMGRQGGVVEELPESIAGLPIADWEDVLHRTLIMQVVLDWKALEPH